MQNTVTRIIRKPLLCLSILLLTACASVNNEDVKGGVNDPMEGLNRASFEVNYFLDGLIFKPVAHLYRDLPPPAVVTAMDNVLFNLGEPLNFINHALQANAQGAANSLFRFVVNSTIGVLGIVDVAKLWFDTPYQQEDFGQTLAAWGVDDGPYAMLPLFGPSNTRDTVGRVVDYFLDPFRYVVDVRNGEEEWARGRSVTDTVSTRAAFLDITDDLEKNSIDYYAAVRSLYKQRRDFLIENKDTKRMEMPKTIIRKPQSPDSIKPEKRSDAPESLNFQVLPNATAGILDNTALPVVKFVTVQ